MNLLSIGGSDPSSGAGIQGDIKTFGAHGNYGVTIVTAVTSQNTSAFLCAEPVSAKILRSQLDAVLSDFEIDGIKVGMVYTLEIVRVLAERLCRLRPRVPIVVDPVVRSTTGGVLLEDSALLDYSRLIVPLADVLTPNMYEARILASVGGLDAGTPRAAALQLQKMGAASVVITGITERGAVKDVVVEGDKRPYVVAGPSISGTTHGGGCTFSAALLCTLAGGAGLSESVRAARKFVTQYLRRPQKVAKGIKIAGVVAGGLHDKLYADLAGAIDAFTRINGIHRSIPECQTNFVYSGPRPVVTRDVLGVLGRITRAGRRVLVAGDLQYGGSKHVATALIAVSKRFPSIRSAVNIRHSDSVISALTDAGLTIYSYDRSKESQQTKSVGSTIEWGVSVAIKDAGGLAPDAIFHRGDYGKEPMIILFGASPDDVLSKVRVSLGHLGS